VTKFNLQLTEAELLALEILASEGAEAILTEPTQVRAWLTPTPGIAAANRALAKVRGAVRAIRRGKQSRQPDF
jgi:hypothetical protein